MAAKIIGLVIGILVLAAGVYYLGKEKNDPESRKARFPQHKESEPMLIIQHYVKECIMVLYNR